MALWEMREAIIKAYPNSTKWKNTVNTMSDSQVQAVYFRLLASGRIK